MSDLVGIDVTPLAQGPGDLPALLDRLSGALRTRGAVVVAGHDLDPQLVDAAVVGLGDGEIVHGADPRLEPLAAAMVDVALVVLRGVSLVLGQRPGFFDRITAHPGVHVRLPVAGHLTDEHPPTVAAAAITMAVVAGSDALAVDGHDVTDGSVVAIAGPVLGRFSNDAIRRPTVVVGPAAERGGLIVVDVAPDAGALVRPLEACIGDGAPHYSAVRVGELDAG